MNRAACFGLLAALFLPGQAVRAPHVSSPKEVLGFEIGEDYRLAGYAQLEAYWKRLESESPRLKLIDIGPTTQGRRQWMAVVSSPENLRKLDTYKSVSAKLAHAEGVTESDSRELSRTGKAIVWIDGGLHATETAGSQQLIETVYRLLSENDEETLRILDDTIALFVVANPDGQDLAANWYMREPDPKKRTLRDLPSLYHSYAGHDDNRDFYMSNLRETTNMNLQMFREWFPQIVYDHHQTGPSGAVIFVPPFRDPFNYNLDPLIPLGVEAIGTAIHSRLVAEGKGGSTMRGGSDYSTWWNGGLRTIAYFHNSIGILTEIVGDPTPTRIPLVADRQLPTSDLVMPVAPQEWHFRQTIDYELTNNRAVLDYASRNRETLLYNMYRMARNSVDRGGRDSWTVTPKRVEALKAATKNGPNPTAYESVLHDPAARDARGYILPSDQPDFPTAVQFVNALIKSGVSVQQAIEPFQVAGRSYAKGSLIVKADQAFRPHILDMFEPQDHPNDFRYPGGPPIPPYDMAGWTLALQMGVRFDRILDDFTGPFLRLPGFASVPEGAVQGPSDAAGYLISHKSNNSFRLTNRVLQAGQDVYWIESEAEPGAGPGSIWVAGTTENGLIESSAREFGLTVTATRAPKGAAYKLKRPRIGVLDLYGGLVPTGWTRWLMEQFEFSYRIVYPQTIDAGDLRANFDVLVFPDGSFPPNGAVAPNPDSVPAEYRAMLGKLTPETSIPALRAFLEDGGSIIAQGRSWTLAQSLGLPVRDYLTESGPDGAPRHLPKEKFYIPGSLLKAVVDTSQPLVYGLPPTVDVMFDDSPAIGMPPDDERKGLKSAMWFAGPTLLDSGWAWGEKSLIGAAAVVEAPVGKGKLFLLAPELTFRGQSAGTFKVFFNALLYGAAEPVTLP